VFVQAGSVDARARFALSAVVRGEIAGTPTEHQRLADEVEWRVTRLGIAQEQQ